MSIFSHIKVAIKKYFLSGLLVIVPLIITYFVLRALLSAIDGILSPLLIKYLGYEIPGLGFVIVIVLIFAAGILTRGVIGRELLNIWENLLSKLPFVRTIYGAARQLLVSVAEPKGGVFKRVVIIPYPRVGMYCFAFAASELSLDNRREEGNYVSVFIPSTPTPFTGYVVMVKKEEVYPADISVEEAIKFIVSGGIIVPEKMNPRSESEIQAS